MGRIARVLDSKWTARAGAVTVLWGAFQFGGGLLADSGPLAALGIVLMLIGIALLFVIWRHPRKAQTDTRASLADVVAVECEMFHWATGDPLNARMVIPGLLVTNRHATAALSVDIGLHVRTVNGWWDAPSDQAHQFPVDLRPMSSKRVTVSFTIPEVWIASLRPAAWPSHDRSLPGNFYRLILRDHVRDERLEVKIPGSYPTPGKFTHGAITPGRES